MELWDRAPDFWPKTVDVVLHVRNVVTSEAINRYADQILEDLQVTLDEDVIYGHPEKIVEWYDSEAVTVAMRQAVGFAMRNREIYYCQPVKTFTVNVREWVEANAPEWVRPTGAMEPPETTEDDLPQGAKPKDVTGCDV